MRFIFNPPRSGDAACCGTLGTRAVGHLTFYFRAGVAAAARWPPSLAAEPSRAGDVIFRFSPATLGGDYFFFLRKKERGGGGCAFG